MYFNYNYIFSKFVYLFHKYNKLFLEKLLFIFINFLK